MALSTVWKRLLVASAAALLLVGGFAFGFLACLHLKSASPQAIRDRQLRTAGDAPPAIRAEVLASLRDFQEGYVKRDPRRLDSFMNQLFPKDNDVLILGTQGGAPEWVRGYSAAAEFIRKDWQNWGDLRFNVEDSVIWASGDVAWVASVGGVRSNGVERPVRFTAILTRVGDRWLFRQLQFQWDDNEPGATDLLHPGTFLKLVRQSFF